MRVSVGDALKAQVLAVAMLSATSTAAPKQQHSLAWELAHGPTEMPPIPVRPVTNPLNMKRSLEAAIKRALRDPDSAKFEWPYGFVRGTYEHIEGMITCGTVNAKNAYGGYTGRQAVAAVVSGDSVDKIDIDQPSMDADEAQRVALECQHLGMPLF